MGWVAEALFAVIAEAPLAVPRAEINPSKMTAKIRTTGFDLLGLRMTLG